MFYSVQYTGGMRLALGKDHVTQTQSMALLRNATLSPRHTIRHWAGSILPSRQCGLCEKAGRAQPSWPAHSCLSRVITSVASHCASSRAATQNLKYSPSL